MANLSHKQVTGLWKGTIAIACLHKSMIARVSMVGFLLSACSLIVIYCFLIEVQTPGNTATYSLWYRNLSHFFTFFILGANPSWPELGAESKS